MSEDITAAVRDVLVDIDYPASKEILVNAAARRSADQDVLKALRGMPPVEYQNEAEVVASIDRPPTGAGDALSDKGRRHREHTHAGLAQHMKEGDPTPIEKELGTNEGS